MQGRVLHPSEFSAPQRPEPGEAPEGQRHLRSEDPPPAGRPGRAGRGRAHLPQPLLRLPHVAPPTEVRRTNEKENETETEKPAEKLCFLLTSDLCACLVISSEGKAP